MVPQSNFLLDPYEEERVVDLIPTPDDTLLLRHAYGCFPSGVTALCACVDGVPVGIAASSFTPVSLTPALVSVCVQLKSTTWPVLRGLPRIGVSVLSEKQSGISSLLSKQDGNRFRGVPWHVGRQGSVFIDRASAWLDCEIRTEIEAGDHQIVVMEVRALRADRSTNPLVFHGSRYRKVASI
jgi:flavin reductase (DIM6/NTAB) family NADH-FMN oxidoreductase RutF